jgi:hypothetical protein
LRHPGTPNTFCRCCSAGVATFPDGRCPLVANFKMARMIEIRNHRLSLEPSDHCGSLPFGGRDLRQVAGIAEALQTTYSAWLRRRCCPCPSLSQPALTRLVGCGWTEPRGPRRAAPFPVLQVVSRQTPMDCRCESGRTHSTIPLEAKARASTSLANVRAVTSAWCCRGRCVDH